MTIQKVTVASMQVEGGRIETGPVEFTYPSGQVDWPGTFIRGDNAGWYAMLLKRVLDVAPPDMAMDVMQLRGLLSDLSECVLGPAGEMLREGQ